MSETRGREARITARARSLWERDGRPKVGEAAYYDQARALIGMEENPQAGRRDVEPPAPAEDATIQENLGEFPSRFTDQGERPQTPSRRPR